MLSPAERCYTDVKLQLHPPPPPQPQQQCSWTTPPPPQLTGKSVLEVLQSLGANQRALRRIIRHVACQSITMLQNKRGILTVLSLKVRTAGRAAAARASAETGRAMRDVDDALGTSQAQSVGGAAYM